VTSPLTFSQQFANSDSTQSWTRGVFSPTSQQGDEKVLYFVDSFSVVSLWTAGELGYVLPSPRAYSTLLQKIQNKCIRFRNSSRAATRSSSKETKIIETEVQIEFLNAGFVSHVICAAILFLGRELRIFK
jgi:hypothetical protein